MKPILQLDMPGAYLERDVSVLSPGSGDILGAQKLQILTQSLTGHCRVNDVIDEATLGGNHRVGESNDMEECECQRKVM